MTTEQLELKQQEPTEPRNQRIRELFDQLGGGMTTAEFARHCIAASIWEDHELERFQIRAAQGYIRESLSETDSGGLPFAGQTVQKGEEGAPLWRQRRLWAYEDYLFNAKGLMKQSDKCRSVAQALLVECQQRFQRSPLFVEPLDQN